MKLYKSNWFLYTILILTILPCLYPLTTINYDIIGSEKFNNEFIYVLSNTLGLIGAWLLFWNVLLGIRFVARVFNENIHTVMDLHKFLGKYGIIFVLLHPVLTMVSYLEEWSWLIQPSFLTTLDRSVNLGRITLILFIIIWVTSALIRSKMKYRPWLYIHYLTYPMVFFVIGHARDIGTFTNSYMPVQYLAELARISFLIILGARVLFWGGLFKDRFTLQKVEEYGDDVYTLHYQGNRDLGIKPGQYVYAQTKRFGESHPYSVLHSNDNELVLGIKSVGPNSHKLTSMKPGNTIFVDGPYGEFTREDESRKKVYYAGGIGVTPFIDSALGKPETIEHFFYSVKTADCIVMRSELESTLKGSITITTTREETKGLLGSRITKEVITDAVSSPQNFNHFICGSHAFTNGMIDQLKSLGVPQSQIFTEEFSM